MDDDDPFSFIIPLSQYSSSVEELLKRLPFVGQFYYPGSKKPELAQPPVPTAAPWDLIQIQDAEEEDVDVVEVGSIRVLENRSPRVSSPVEEPSPNQPFRDSRREVGECSRKRKLEIPKDVDVIMIEDSEEEEEVVEEEEVQEVEIAEDVGRKKGRILPLWARGNQEAQNSVSTQHKKVTEGITEITMWLLLTVLEKEEREARSHLGRCDYLEIAMRRGVHFPDRRRRRKKHVDKV